MVEQSVHKRRITEPVQGSDNEVNNGFLACNTLQTTIFCELHLYPTMQQSKIHNPAPG